MLRSMKLGQQCTWAFYLSLLFALSIRGQATIDQNSCTGYANDVNSALNEAISIANFASTRWQGRPTPRPGTLLQDMLGAPNEDDQATLSFAQPWFQKAAGAGSNNLIIYCTDEHLTGPIAPGKFRDPQNGNAQVTIGTSNTACAGRLRAFSYPGPNRNVIVLCSDSANGALKSPNAGSIGTWNSQGHFLGQTIDVFGLYLSYRILHELFHCADFQQFPSMLPSGQGEKYEYKEITSGIDSTDRQHNADSMALLGCAWYLKRYRFERSIAALAKPADRPP